MLKTRHHLSLIAVLAAGLLLTGFAASSLAQSQDDSAQSVAEAARRAREKKKAGVKPVKTLTDDDLPAATAAGSSEAGAAATPTKAAAAGATPAPAAAAKPVDAVAAEKAKLEYSANVAALDRAKKSLVQFESELDVMQRKAKLDSEAYYSKPDFSNDPGGKAKLDGEAQDITTKQEDIETLKARIAELQAAVEAGAPRATESKPPAEEKPPSQ
jgi:hypothetical protein